MTGLDLTRRTYRTACHLALEFARQPNGTVDRTKASTELARLLWHVRAEDGGFVGLTDDQRGEKITVDPRLRLIDWKIVEAFAWDAGHWSEAASAIAQAAE